MLSPPLVFQSQQLRQFVPGVPKFVGFYRLPRGLPKPQLKQLLFDRQNRLPQLGIVEVPNIRHFGQRHC
jgi:hypothetical protein